MSEMHVPVFVPPGSHQEAPGASLVLYDAMCRAIQEAYAVDEVKDIRDKAIALEEYARRARNTEAERQACEIRLRAERRCGELSREMLQAQGHRSDLTLLDRPTKSEALAQAHISREQAAEWERLAAIPEAEFEADITDPNWRRPTTSGLLSRHDARTRDPVDIQPVDDNALWLWGRLQDFERNGLLNRDPSELLPTMLEHMQTTTRRLAPIVATWLGRIK